MKYILPLIILLTIPLTSYCQLILQPGDSKIIIEKIEYADSCKIKLDTCKSFQDHQEKLINIGLLENNVLRQTLYECDTTKKHLYNALQSSKSIIANDKQTIKKAFFWGAAVGVLVGIFLNKII